MREVQLLDASVLDEFLEVPGKSKGDGAVQEEFERRQQLGVVFHLPVAAIFQVASHIGRLPNGADRRACATRLSRLIRRTLDGEAPWGFLPLAWDSEYLAQLLSPRHTFVLDLVESLAQEHLEIGDLLLIGEFERVRSNLDRRVVDVDVWTLDAALRGVVDAIRAGPN